MAAQDTDSGETDYAGTKLGTYQDMNTSEDDETEYSEELDNHETPKVL